MKTKTIKLISFVTLFTLTALLACTSIKSTSDSGTKPLIHKLGTIDCDLVETTPVVFKGKVVRFEYVRQGYWDNKTGDSYFRFVDHKTGKVSESFAKGFHFGSAFIYKDKIIVSAVDLVDGEQVHLFVSDDMIHWERRLALELPETGMFNTSITHDGRKFVLMYEIGKPQEKAGNRFTANFATSTDLKKWDNLDPKYNYAKDRYTAPHSLRYLDGYYYNFYLEAYNGYEMRVVRSKDLELWEASPLNPVLVASPEDKQIANKKLSKELRQRITAAENRNNSDIDFCEFKGKLIINYSWGNQRGEEFLAEASYDGTLEEFLKGWFPK